ncbi:MAG: ribonuclease H-like domain-containing protein [Spirochaetales bacterium]|nr:ribonuclease H-like domain-containing protein [Spirochaetales bacterium]
MASLKDRLRRAREIAGARADAPRAPAPKSADRASPEGFEGVGPGLLLRETFFPLDLPETWNLEPFLGGADLSALGNPRAVEARRLRFFDLETTGLSGGAGTIAFLAAVGRAVAGGLLVRQWLLEDWPGEVALLAELARELDPEAVLVSYNGRSFDVPLIRGRFVLNRSRCPERPHADILHACRRLWRRTLGSCSLQALESAVLGRAREADIPGAEIPEVFIAFARTGRDERMDLVARHNARDVASLASLAFETVRAHEYPFLREDIDLGSLGAWLSRRDAALARAVLERGFARGDARSGLALAALCRREGDEKSRDAILGELAPTPFTLVERAKRAEHALRDPASALAFAEAALALEGRQAARAALERRIARLLRKTGMLA